MQVVAVESGAVAEIIVNGVNGIFSSQNPTELANQVTGRLLYPPQRLALGQSAHNLSSLSAQKKKMLPDHVFLYTEIVTSLQPTLAPH